MAASSATCKVPHHARSISLPTRSHPFTLKVEEQLRRLRASESTSSSSSSICYNLGGLEELYECVDDLLQLPLTQQALSLERHEKWVDGVLDGSLGLLDACGTSRDVLSQMKQCVQDLQSSLRRRRGGEFDQANEVGAYMISRKKVNKVIRKCLGDMKRRENTRAFSLLDKDHDLVAIVSVLREVEATTLAVFESLLLSFVSGSKARSKQSSWSLVSKLMHSRRVTCNKVEGADTSEVETVDVALNALISHKQQHKGVDLKHAQKRLEELKMSIQILEDGLECVFRRLIKSRVSLLNILNQ